jgi:LysM repeat protein
MGCATIIKIWKEIEEIAMASMKRGAMVASMLVLAAMSASACNQPYSQQPSVTNTPINPNSLFATPMGLPTNMNDLESLATGTALAILSGTPVDGAITATPVVVLTQDGTNPTLTPTSMITLPTGAVVTPTATLAVTTSQPAAATSVPGSRPSTYTLQSGEYPYCIARRYNVDPAELLSLNGLVEGQTLYAGKVLNIPQSGKPFPGSRMWHNHPDTYTVDSSSDTIYGIACYYGDIMPEAIAQANGISVGSALTAGQRLTIP